MSSFHFRVAEIVTPKFLTLLHTSRSLPFFITREIWSSKPNAYSLPNPTLKQLSFSLSTIIHVGEFSGVWVSGTCLMGSWGGGKIFFASNRRAGSVYPCFSRDVTDYANLVIRHAGVPRSVLLHVNKRVL